MPLIYLAVFRGTTTLADYAAYTGNYNSIAKEYLIKAASNEGKVTYTVDGHTFSFFSTGGFAYVVVADESMGRVLPLHLLDQIQQEFAAKYVEKAQTAREGQLNASFGKALRQMHERATANPEAFNKVAAVQKKVDEVKGIMTDNIDKMLARGEKLELLTDKTDTLMNEATRFQRTGRGLRRQLWWQNCKLKLVMAGAVLLLGLIIFLLICFSKGNCLKRGD